MLTRELLEGDRIRRRGRTKYRDIGVCLRRSSTGTMMVHICCGHIGFCRSSMRWMRLQKSVGRGTMLAFGAIRRLQSSDWPLWHCCTKSHGICSDMSSTHSQLHMERVDPDRSRPSVRPHALRGAQDGGVQPDPLGDNAERLPPRVGMGDGLFRDFYSHPRSHRRVERVVGTR